MTVSSSSRPALRRIVVLAVVALAAALLPLLSTAGAGHVDAHILRFAGENRFDTARLIASDPAYAEADTVVVARADDFADALAGALIAGHRQAPLLLTRTGDLPAATVQAINRIGPSRAVILGGSQAVSDAVQRRLEDFSSITTVERISGEDRFDTARRIAERVAQELSEQETSPLPTEEPTTFGRAPAFDGGEGDLVTAVLATGGNFPDALAAGPLSAGGLFPILLTDRDELSPATREALDSETLGIEQVLIVGGPGAVSDAVEAALLDLELPVRRLAGPDRTRTAEEVASFSREIVFEQTFETDTVAVANGRDFPDALALGPLAAERGGPLVITNTPTDLSAAATEFLTASCAGAGAEDAPVLVGGGPGAVSPDVEQQIAEAVVCADFVPAGGLEVAPLDQTAAVDEQITITATGTNAKGAPAAGAEITFEVFRDVLALPGPLPEDARLYREDDGLFRKVLGTTLQANTLGAATLGYTGTDAAEDRVVVCTPPRELPNPGCTDETGALRDDVPWATVVARVVWEGDDDTDLPPAP